MPSLFDLFVSMGLFAKGIVLVLAIMSLIKRLHQLKSFPRSRRGDQASSQLSSNVGQTQQTTPAQ